MNLKGVPKPAPESLTHKKLLYLFSSADNWVSVLLSSMNSYRIQVEDCAAVFGFDTAGLPDMICRISDRNVCSFEANEEILMRRGHSPN